MENLLSTHKIMYYQYYICQIFYGNENWRALNAVREGINKYELLSNFNSFNNPNFPRYLPIQLRCLKGLLRCFQETLKILIFKMELEWHSGLFIISKRRSVKANLTLYETFELFPNNHFLCKFEFILCFFVFF